MWNMTEQFIWKVARSQYAEDCPAPPTKRTWVGEGIWDYKWKIDILAIVPCAPLANSP